LSTHPAGALRRAAPAADPFTDPGPAIACVPWPSEAARRRHLAVAGVPRLLFVEPGAAPPDHWDADEDWIRIPATAEEVTLRAETLRSRLGG
jgi:hypothetical protein